MGDAKGQYVYYTCDECQTSPLSTCRWACQVCDDFDICDSCHVAHKHDKSMGRRHEMERVPIKQSMGDKDRSLARVTLERRSRSGKDVFSLSLGVFESVLNEFNLELPKERKVVAPSKAEEFLSLYESALEQFDTRTQRQDNDEPMSREQKRALAQMTLVLVELSVDNVLDEVEVFDSATRTSYLDNIRLVLPLLETSVKLIMKSDRMKWFWQPVSPNLSGYDDKIEKRMDLGTVTKRLSNYYVSKALLVRGGTSSLASPTSASSPSAGSTTSTGAFSALGSPGPPSSGLTKMLELIASDLKLVWDNAIVFNAPETAVYMFAVKSKARTSTILALIAKATGIPTARPLFPSGYWDTKEMPQGRIPSPTARDGSSRKRAFSLTVSEDGASVDSAGGRSSRRLSASRVVVNGGAMEDTDSMAAGKARKRAAMARNQGKENDQEDEEGSVTGGGTSSAGASVSAASIAAARPADPAVLKEIKEMREELRLLNEKVKHIAHVVKKNFGDILSSIAESD